MSDPRKTILDWWKLVKPGGYLFVVVPDEDLYEQGVFPSRFNNDHKATFTIAKAKSWSPNSINVLEPSEDKLLQILSLVLCWNNIWQALPCVSGTFDKLYRFSHFSVSAFFGCRP